MLVTLCRLVGTIAVLLVNVFIARAFYTAAPTSYTS